jgi:hypothetical protein
VDVLTFAGVVLAIGTVLGGAASSGDPTALFFVQLAVWVMAATLGIFGLMLLVNRVGLRRLFVLVPIVLAAVVWAAGIPGTELARYWKYVLVQRARQAAVYGGYGLVGLM